VFCFGILPVENPVQGAPAGKISVSPAGPSSETMPLEGLIQDADVVQMLWMAVGSVEDWTLRLINTGLDHPSLPFVITGVT